MDAQRKRPQPFSQQNGVELREYVERIVQDQKEHFERAIRDQQQYYESRLNAVEKATAVAAESLNSRLTTMNEMRGSLEDARRNMPSSAEFTDIQRRVQDNEKRFGEYLTSSQYQTYKSSADSDIRELRESRAELAGKASHGSMLLTLGLASLSLLLSAVGAISTAMNLIRLP